MTAKPKPNFLAQFGGPKPDTVMWCIEVTAPEGVVIIYVAPTWYDALCITKNLRTKHTGARIRIVGDILVNN